MFKLNKRGDATLGEVMLVIALLGVVMWGQYESRLKQSEADTLNGNSTKTETATHNDTNKYQLAEIVFAPFNFEGCVPKHQMDTWTQNTAANKEISNAKVEVTQATNEVKTDAAIATNGEVSGW